MARGTQLALLYNGAGLKQINRDTPLSPEDLDTRLNLTSRNWITADKTIEDIFDCIQENLTGRDVTRVLYRLPIEGEFNPASCAVLGAYTYGAAAAPVGATANKVITVTVTLSAGGYRLTLPAFDGMPAETTTLIPYNATASQVKRALETLNNMGTGNVQISLLGNVYTITFIGKRAHVNLPTLTADFSEGSGGTVVVAQTTPGSQRTHLISEITDYQPPYTSFGIALQDELGSGRIIAGAVLDNIRFRGAAGSAGLVTFTGDIIARQILPGDELVFPDCAVPKKVRTSDCAFGYKSVDYSTILDSFDFGFGNNILTGDHAKPGRGMLISRAERANRRTRSLAIALRQGIVNDLYAEAESNPEADSKGAAYLRVGTPGDNLTLDIPHALPELAGGGLGFAGEAEESVNNLTFTPTQQGATPPTSLTAYTAQDTAYLTAAA